jgi:HAD superfamily hydrolase (TIGR01509 family)
MRFVTLSISFIFVTMFALSVPTNGDRVSRRFEAVLFDFSGTLFDDSGVLTVAGVRAAAGRRGIDLDQETAARLIETMLATVDSPAGLAAREGADRSAQRHRTVWTELMASADIGYLPGVSPESVAEAFYEHLTDPGAWQPYPDTAGTLTGLHQAGLRIAVVSNIGWDIRPAFVTHGVADLVDVFALSYEHASVKPEPALFRYACEELGVPPERALFVGDDPVKDGGAIKVGMPVYLLPGERSPRRPRGLAAVLALTDVPASSPVDAH